MSSKRTDQTPTDSSQNIAPDPPSAESPHEKQVLDDEPSHRPFRIRVFQIIYKMRLQHGMRHNDAVAYNSYCTARLRKLRVALNFRYGRPNGRYVHRPLPEDFKDKRFLLLPLVSAERSWAVQFQIGAAIEAATRAHEEIAVLRMGKKKVIKELPTPFRAILQLKEANLLKSRRLKKSVKHAKTLKNLCDKHADALTKIEADAYLANAQALYHSHQRNWSRVIEKTEKAKLLYLKLLSFLQSEEENSQKVDEHISAIKKELSTVDQTLRSVSYHQRLEGKSLIESEKPPAATDPDVPLKTIYFRGAAVQVPEYLEESNCDALIEEEFITKNEVSLELLKKTLNSVEKLINEIQSKILNEDEMSNLIFESFLRDRLNCYSVCYLIIQLTEIIKERCDKNKFINYHKEGSGVLLCDIIGEYLNKMRNEFSENDSLIKQNEMSKVLIDQFDFFILIIKNCRLLLISSVKLNKEVLISQKILSYLNELPLNQILDHSNWRPFSFLEKIVKNLFDQSFDLHQIIQLDIAERLLNGSEQAEEGRDSVIIPKDEILKYEVVANIPILFDLAEYYLPLPPLPSCLNKQLEKSHLVERLTSWFSHS